MTQKNEAENNGIFRTSKFLKQTWRRGRGRKQNKQLNNLCQLQKNNLAKEKSGMNENRTRKKIHRFCTSETRSEKRSRNATNSRESSFNRHCSQHKLSQKRDTHTHTHKRGRAPGPEQTTSQKRGIKEDSLSSRHNPALYQVQVLKTRGRL